MGVLLSGDRLSGADAARLGLAYRSFPRDRFDDEVELFVSAMADRDRGALTAIKRLVLSGLQEPAATGLDDEITAVVRHISEGAGRNGASAFSERGGTR
jgi:enoyl-CoA hydratase/carnithine racemase